MNDFEKRFCFECEHFDLEFGTPDYSEYTPGEMPEMFCEHGQFEGEGHCGLNLEKFKRLIRKARTCQYFELEES